MNTCWFRFALLSSPARSSRSQMGIMRTILIRFLRSYFKTWRRAQSPRMRNQTMVLNDDVWLPDDLSSLGEHMETLEEIMSDAAKLKEDGCLDLASDANGNEEIDHSFVRVVVAENETSGTISSGQTFGDNHLFQENPIMIEGATPEDGVDDETRGFEYNRGTTPGILLPEPSAVTPVSIIDEHGPEEHVATTNSSSEQPIQTSPKQQIFACEPGSNHQNQGLFASLGSSLDRALSRMTLWIIFPKPLVEEFRLAACKSKLQRPILVLGASLFALCILTRGLVIRERVDKTSDPMNRPTDSTVPASNKFDATAREMICDPGVSSVCRASPTIDVVQRETEIDSMGSTQYSKNVLRVDSFYIPNDDEDVSRETQPAQSSTQSDMWDSSKPSPLKPTTLYESLEQARTYERRIVLSHAYQTSVLNELVYGGLWEQWAIHAKHNPVLSLFYVPNYVKELRTVIANIQKHLVRQLRQAIDNPTIFATQDTEETFYDLQSRFIACRSSVLAYFEFTKLLEFDCTLLTQTLNEVSSEMERFEARLAVIFTRLSLTTRRSIDDPVVLCDTLDFVRTSHVFQAAKAFSQSPIARDRRKGRVDLITTIVGCPDYEQLQSEANRLVRKHSHVLNTFTFDLAGSDNEHERRFHYENVRLSLEFVSAGACLRSSLSLRDRSSMPDFNKEREKALLETRKVGNRVLDVLMQFPTHEADFSVLRRAMGNLATLSEVFRVQDPALSSTAQNIAQDAKKRLRVRLEEFHADSCVDYGRVLQSILQLKRASREVPSYVSEINMAIDHCLDKGAKIASNAGRFLLTLSLELRAIEGNDAPIAKQLIAEHKCFEWAVNAIYNAATARQGIDYVITKMELKREEALRLKLMYDAFDLEYNSLLREGLSYLQVGNAEEFLTLLVTRVSQIAGDKIISHSDRTWLLSAYAFAYWTLDNASTLATLPDGLVDDISTYLKKPHAPQVTAIWQLLGSISHSDFRDLENHFVELKTGEGKSIVLGIASIILALSNFDVTVICYSDYLSQRDFADFKSMFIHFGVDTDINYGTVDNLVESIMSETGDIRTLALETIRGMVTHTKSISHDNGKQKVLLVDEVDVFFNRDFFGQSYRPAATLSSPQTQALVSYVWKNRGHLRPEDLIMSKVVEECINSIDKQFGHLIKYEALAMLQDAKNVDSWQPYIVSEERIAYKHFDGLTFSKSYGYETMFAYLKEYDNGVISYETMERYMGVDVLCGEISYAELPNTFDHIMGLSGTVRGLSKEERKILSDIYAVNKLSYIPSAYGENQLEFRKDDPRDILLTSSKDEYFLELRNEIYLRRKPRDGNHDVRRAVMVFFEHSEILLEFFESKPMEDLKRETRVITEVLSPSEKKSAFAKATEQGAITLLIRDYGRGTDFKCFDTKMLDAGGTHVIQAFYSSEQAEEIQIKGRTARQGTKGSYSLVLNFAQLNKDLGVSWDDFMKMRNKRDYGEWLEMKRSTLTSVNNRNTMKSVRDLESMHYRTLAFLENMSDGNNVTDSVKFILEQRGGEASAPFLANKLKESYIMDRQLRKDKSRKNSSSFRIDLAATLIGHFGDLPKTADEVNVARADYYAMLGLPRNVSMIALMGSLRLLESHYRSQRGGEEEIEILLNMTRTARTVLLDENLRVSYDFLIAATQDSYKAKKDHHV